MRIPASLDTTHASRAGPGGSQTARDAYLDRLQAVLGADRTRMIASAWSGATVPPWLTERPPAGAPVPSQRRGRRSVSMIRQTTTACVAAALGSCLFLYWGKSQATMADREIGRMVRATQEAHARVGALRAEWALLNQPDRLADIAGRYLKLRPVAPAQFAEPGRLADRLQAPLATPAEDAEPDTVLAEADSAQVALQPAADAPGIAAEPLPKAPAANEHKAALAEAAPPEALPPRAKPAAAAPDGSRPATNTPAIARQHASAKTRTPRYLAPMIAEAREALRDSGEALLNSDPDQVRVRPRVERAGAYGMLPGLPRTETGIRVVRRLPPPRIDLPHWLMQAHLMRPGRSESPHALSMPQGTAIPLAAPRPEAATVQRVIARPAPEADHPPPQAESAEPSPQIYQAPRYRPAYRQNYAYGNPYRPYWNQPYGGYGGPYGNPYNRFYPPPPQSGGYYQ